MSSVSVLLGFNMESTKLVVDLIKTQVTISAGSFIITCNFTKDQHSNCVRISLILFAISIIFCPIALGRIIGLTKEYETKKSKIYKKKTLILDCFLRICIGISMVFFFLGGLFLLVHVW